MKFYITTPLYYVNAEPHIGHAYTTVAADCLARFHRMDGAEVFFLTGTDEHGQKIAEAARQKNLAPKQLADSMVEVYQNLWRKLDISYDHFIRTTDTRHEEVVKKAFAHLLEKGDIYPGLYKGYYCIPCESYVLPEEAARPVCPDCGRPVQETSEPSYFFRISAYQAQIKEHVLQHPEFVKPDFRRNEVLNLLKDKLPDLSITRKFSTWGVESPTAEKYSIYVWFDALLNYLSGVGYLQGGPSFEKFWPPDVQLIGKDIMRFHHIIWPALLLALGVALPRTVFAHGWWVVGKDKMSKSKGNVVAPTEVISDYGTSAFRFFLLREVPFGLDGEFSEENFKKRYNSDLANDLGNLVNRTLNLIEKKCSRRIPKAETEERLAGLVEEVFRNYQEKIRNLTLSEGLAEIWKLVTYLNKYLDEQAPWRLEGAQANRILYQVAEGIRISSLFLTPFIPETARDIWRILGLETDPTTAGFNGRFEKLTPGKPVAERKILFPRRT